MAITAITPALYPNGTKSNDLEDVTYSCVQCGTTVIRTLRTHPGDARAIARRAIFPPRNQLNEPAGIDTTLCR